VPYAGLIRRISNRAGRVLLVWSGLTATTCADMPELYGDWELVAIDGVSFDELRVSREYTGQEAPNISLSAGEYSGYDGCNWFGSSWNDPGVQTTLVGCDEEALKLPLDLWDLKRHLSSATANGDRLTVPKYESYPSSTYVHQRHYNGPRPWRQCF